MSNENGLRTGDRKLCSIHTPHHVVSGIEQEYAFADDDRRGWT
jgi:hypothetical protein